jgi:hypothetical protein
MGKSSDAPKPPDPEKVAAAQTKSNKATAIANAYLNRIDQTSPFGTNTYKVVGTNPDGTPKFAQSTEFSPEMQGIFDNYIGMTQGMGDIGQMQLGQLQQQYSQPFDLNTEAENKIVELQRARLDPLMQQQEAAIRTRLTNQGIREGTEAWDRAMSRQGQISNDAYNQMFINARQQGVNEALLQRQLPLNEFNALRTGSQVGMPQFTQVPGTQMANTDVAGITQNAYNQQMAQWNAQNQQNNAFMGGLFQMGAAAVPFMFSDRRLKTNVVEIGALPSGLKVYEFDYVWGGPRQIGVMAQEARDLFPHAVADFGGYLAVNYAEIG